MIKLLLNTLIYSDLLDFMNTLKDKGICTLRLNLPCELRDKFKSSLALKGENMTDKLIAMINEYLENEKQN